MTLRRGLERERERERDARACACASQKRSNSHHHRRCVVVMSRWRWLLGGNDDDCVERHTKSTPNEKNDIKEEEEIPLLLVFPDDAIGKGKKTTSRKKSVAALAMMSAMALALLAFCGAVGRRETTVGLESRLGARMYMVFWGRDGFDYDDACLLYTSPSPRDA